MDVAINIVVKTRYSFLVYRFKASPSGTHWYHSHHGAMRREGLSGAFIVLPRQEVPYSKLEHQIKNSKSQNLLYQRRNIPIS